MTPQQLNAMKLALEALELLTGAWQTFGALDYGDNAITAIKEVLAEHAMREVQRLGQEIEQAPVAWEQFYPDIGKLQIEFAPVKMVAYNCTCGRTIKFESEHGVVAPQRTWVGLTDEDMADITSLPIGTCSMMLKVEAKLKEKNT